MVHSFAEYQALGFQRRAGIARTHLNKTDVPSAKRAARVNRA
jgi:hypothetical protein